MKLTDGQNAAAESLRRNGVPLTFNVLWDDIVKTNGSPSGFWFNTMHSLEKKGLVKKYHPATRAEHVLWELV